MRPWSAQRIRTEQEQAKYAYRSIAQFVKHVTENSADHLDRNAFPELHRPRSRIYDSSGSDAESPHLPGSPSSKRPRIPKDLRSPNRSGVDLYQKNEAQVEDEVLHGQAETLPDRIPPGEQQTDDEV